MVKSLQDFGWNNVDPSSQTVAQHYFTIGPMYCVIQGQSPNAVSMLGQRRIRLTGIQPTMGCDAGPTYTSIGWVGLHCVYWIHRIDTYTDLSVDFTVCSEVKETRGSIHSTDKYCMGVGQHRRWWWTE